MRAAVGEEVLVTDSHVGDGGRVGVSAGLHGCRWQRPLWRGGRTQTT